MSAVDRLTDAKCQAVARTLVACFQNLDGANINPAEMISPGDLEAVQEFVAEFGAPAAVDIEDDGNK